MLLPRFSQWPVGQFSLQLNLCRLADRPSPVWSDRADEHDPLPAGRLLGSSRCRKISPEKADDRNESTVFCALPHM